DGGVHSSMEHLRALIELADAHRVRVVLHAFLDGRDTPPRSAGKYLQEAELWLKSAQGTFGTISGRYYALDRDKRWERVQRAYHAIVRAPRDVHVRTARNAREALNDAYDRGESDEFVVPTRVGGYTGIDGNFIGEFSRPEGPWEWMGREV